MCSHQHSTSPDTFVIHQINSFLYAIEEPTYYQGNFSYLIVGSKRALMFDAGANTALDITQTIRQITDLPFSVLPSHLHFDHIGGLKFFKDILLPDLACLKAFKTEQGSYHIPDEFHYGSVDGFVPDVIVPKQLIKIGEVIDLGDIQLRVLHAPGHSQDSIVLYEENQDILLLGDVLYPNELYVGNLTEYQKSLDHLKDIITDQTRMYGAHPFTTSHLPQVMMEDIKQTLSVMQAIAEGRAEVKSVVEPTLVKTGKRHCVNQRICIYTDIVFKNDLDFSYAH